MSLAGKKKATSTHGLQLLKELSDPLMARERLDLILSYIKKDPNAGKLKSRELGNTAYHYLMHRDYPESFIISVLNALLESCPTGIKIMNKYGCLAIHACVRRPGDISRELMAMLLNAYPESLKVKPTTNENPMLFLSYIKRVEPVNIDIIQDMIKMCPEIVEQMDHDLNVPLHFACKKLPYVDQSSLLWKEEGEDPDELDPYASHTGNNKLVQILLRRYPEGASKLNRQRALPLHLLCAHCDNVSLVKQVHLAYPSAMNIADIQGRTCLHHATLFIGQKQLKRFSSEELEMMRKRDELAAEERVRISAKGKKGGDMRIAELKREREEKHKAKEDEENMNEKERAKYYDSEEYDNNDERDGHTSDDYGSDNDNEDGEEKDGQEYKDTYGLSRDVLRYLVKENPEALIRMNNFQATPVETVLEKTKQIRHKYKTVSVFGMYDDPVTARQLLLAHHHYSKEEPAPSFASCDSLEELGVRSRSSSSASMMGRSGSSMALISPFECSDSPNKQGGYDKSGEEEDDSPSGSMKGNILLPPVKAKHMYHLRTLNFMARKDALLCSLVGTPRPFVEGITATSYAQPTPSPSTTPRHKNGIIGNIVGIEGSLGDLADALPKDSEGSKNKMGKAAKRRAAKEAAKQKATQQKSKGGEQNQVKIASNNILGRLRQEGSLDCVRLIISYL